MALHFAHLLWKWQEGSPSLRLDVYIYDYLIKRKLITTAEAFVKETEAKPFVTDLQKINVPGGLLSDWWPIFWPSFISSPGDLACPEVLIWNLRNNLEQRSWDAHSSFITDISFRPNESMLATASSDRTLRLWDASQGDCYFQAQCFTGHSTQVTSVEFHPNYTSLLCSCDDGGKTGKAKVRFHPRGKILASAIGHTVNITDVETDERFKCLQGNRDNKPLNSICWIERINCLACVSDNCAKVWSTDGQTVRELNRNGYFRSCSFHPRYPNTLVIGGYESITLWNFAENKVESVQAHGCHLSDLDGCLATGLLASASHDGCVKVWR
ncbi:transcriptional corepressor LEUNIG-like [Panicum miliaceum]|uniref:Transcriptional corepressor LEUNIG-like n=1 Tax=Panicum miliaceum TaxID=4540 RepID=A0A3L6TJH8_PANMI|nr:transcriptional corepressor LEUNIG-like [Panicum miliaceum]